MKIALLSEKYTPDIGGLAISAGRLARLLSLAGHSVRVFVPTPGLPPSETRTLEVEGVPVTRFGNHKRVEDTSVAWLDLVTEEHRREPFDLLHAYYLVQAGFVATFGGRYLNVPSVVSIRGNDIERAPFDPARFAHVNYVLHNADAVSTNARELARKAQALTDRSVIVIPNSVDTSRFRPLPRNGRLAETLGLKSDSGNDLPVIGFVGELRAKKGLRPLLDAFAEIDRNRPSALLIVGEVRPGEDRQRFEEFAASHRNARIHVTGRVSAEDLPEYYSLIDVHLHPSLRDGMPNAVLEAMACGRPVIASAVGGIPDVIKHGRNGLLVAANDSGAVAVATDALLGDPHRRAALGATARQTVLDEFTEERELEGNLDVYAGLGVRV